MRIYVASGWTNRVNARKLMDELEARGHVITVDWPSHVWPEDASESVIKALTSEYARRDEQGVLTADMLVLLFPTRLGSNTEFGIALGTGKKIAMVGERKQENVFYASKRVDFEFNSKEEFLEFMDSVERKGGIKYTT
jgi:hypothetical protein